MSVAIRRMSVMALFVALASVLGVTGARAQDKAVAEARVGGNPARSPGETMRGDYPEPGDRSGAWASGTASGSGNGTATAIARARTGPSTRPSDRYGQTPGGKSAEAQANSRDPRTGKPTAKARTSGEGTSARALGKNGADKVEAQSVNGNNPADIKPGAGGMGGMGGLGGAVGVGLAGKDARRLLEQAIRDSEAPEDLKQQMLEQLK